MLRRNREPRVLMLEVLAVFWSFTFAAFGPGQTAILDDPSIFPRMAIPSVAALLVLVWRNAVASPEDSAQTAPMLDVVLAYGCAFLTQMVAARMAPRWALPHWYTTEGGLVGPWFLLVVRALFPPPGRRSPEDGSPMETGGRAGVWKWGAVLAVAAVGAMAVAAGIAGGGRVRAGCAVILAGCVYMGAGLVGERGGRGLLVRAGYWIYGSLAPGLALILIGTRVYCFVFVLIALLLAELTRRAGMAQANTADPEYNEHGS